MTRRPPALMLALVLVAALFTGASAVASAQTPCGPGVEAVRVNGAWLCTHGNDDPPPGVDTTQLPTTDELLEARYGVDSRKELVAATEGDEPVVAAGGTVACIGDGISGPRIQLVYARASNVTGRYSSVLPLLRQYAADADSIVNVSAGLVGEGRRIRYVTNAACEPEVMNITLSTTGDDSFSNMVSELQAKGLTSSDRKYMVYVDAAVGICGLGQVYLNDRGDQLNPNNTGRAMYARVDTSCWQYAVAHEMLHTMGAVQNSAPNSSGAGHCTDEVDVMCYKDTSSTVVRQVCSRAGQVDCNNDDYFHPNPKASSYLDTKWNVARSRYLANTAAPPPPPSTTVTVPASTYAGVPMGIRADIATSGATIVWSSTRSDCWFGNPHTLQTTWTCPAGATGSAEVTALITEGSITTGHSRTVALLVPSSPLATSVSLVPSSTSIVAGRTVSLHGTVAQSATNAPIAGLMVRAWARPKGSSTWSRIADVATSRTGRVRVDVKPLRNTAYRLTTVGTSTWAYSTSGAYAVNVKAKVTGKKSRTLTAGMRTRREAGTVRIAGAVSPDKAGKRIVLKVRRDGRWRTIRSKDINQRSRYVFKYTPRKSGRYALRVVKPRDKRNLRSRVQLSVRL